MPTRYFALRITFRGFRRGAIAYPQAHLPSRVQRRRYFSRAPCTPERAKRAEAETAVLCAVRPVVVQAQQHIGRNPE